MEMSLFCLLLGNIFSSENECKDNVCPQNSLPLVLTCSRFPEICESPCRSAQTFTFPGQRGWSDSALICALETGACVHTE